MTDPALPADPSSPDIVIVDHHIDEAARLYRVVLAYQETRIQPRLDPDGEPMRSDDPDDPRILTEEVKVQSRPWDIVFDADDPQWQGLTPIEIATRQRDIVWAAMTTAPDQPDPDALTQLPGVGDVIGPQASVWSADNDGLPARDVHALPPPPPE